MNFNEFCENLLEDQKEFDKLSLQEQAKVITLKTRAIEESLKHEKQKEAELFFGRFTDSMTAFAKRNEKQQIDKTSVQEFCLGKQFMGDAVDSETKEEIQRGVEVLERFLKEGQDAQAKIVDIRERQFVEVFDELYENRYPKSPKQKYREISGSYKGFVWQPENVEYAEPYLTHSLVWKKDPSKINIVTEILEKVFPDDHGFLDIVHESSVEGQEKVVFAIKRNTSCTIDYLTQFEQNIEKAIDALNWELMEQDVKEQLVELERLTETLSTTFGKEYDGIQFEFIFEG